MAGTGGALNLSPDGVMWETIPLAMAQNSSGWPIVKAGDKEHPLNGMESER